MDEPADLTERCCSVAIGVQRVTWCVRKGDMRGGRQFYSFDIQPGRLGPGVHRLMTAQS